VLNIIFGPDNFLDANSTLLQQQQMVEGYISFNNLLVQLVIIIRVVVIS
jgi:hypothetical protein